MATATLPADAVETTSPIATATTVRVAPDTAANIAQTVETFRQFVTGMFTCGEEWEALRDRHGLTDEQYSDLEGAWGILDGKRRKNAATTTTAAPFVTAGVIATPDASPTATAFAAYLSLKPFEYCTVDNVTNDLAEFGDALNLGGIIEPVTTTKDRYIREGLSLQGGSTVASWTKSWRHENACRRAFYEAVRAFINDSATWAQLDALDAVPDFTAVANAMRAEGIAVYEDATEEEINNYFEEQRRLDELKIATEKAKKTKPAPLRFKTKLVAEVAVMLWGITSRAEFGEFIDRVSDHPEFPEYRVFLVNIRETFPFDME